MNWAISRILSFACASFEFSKYLSYKSHLILAHPVFNFRNFGILVLILVFSYIWLHHTHNLFDILYSALSR